MQPQLANSIAVVVKANPKPPKDLGTTTTKPGVGGSPTTSHRFAKGNKSSLFGTCRIQPTCQFDPTTGSVVVPTETMTTATSAGGFAAAPSGTTFKFDQCYPPTTILPLSTQTDDIDLITRRDPYSDVVAPLVDAFVYDGANACVMAYGQTGSGKTYTMFGPPATNPANGSTAAATYPEGVIPQLLAAVTSKLKFLPGQKKKKKTAPTVEAKQQPPALTDGEEDHVAKRLTFSGAEFSLEAALREEEEELEAAARHKEGFRCEESLALSVVELYLEQAKCLLTGKDVEVVERHHGATTPGKHTAAGQGPTSCFARGAKLIDLSQMNATEANAVLTDALKGRRSRSTALNRRSSRSHVIVMLQLTRRTWDEKSRNPATTMTTTAKEQTSFFKLVDLAGNERYDYDSRTDPQQHREARSINKSLSALNKVLQEVSRRTCVGSGIMSPSKDGLATARGALGTAPAPPASAAYSFRESILTRLLQDSLAGNSATTCIIATVVANNLKETLNTLRYADTMRHITTQSAPASVIQVQIATSPVVSQKPKSARTPSATSRQQSTTATNKNGDAAQSVPAETNGPVPFHTTAATRLRPTTSMASPTPAVVNGEDDELLEHQDEQPAPSTARSPQCASPNHSMSASIGVFSPWLEESGLIANLRTSSDDSSGVPVDPALGTLPPALNDRESRSPSKKSHSPLSPVRSSILNARRPTGTPSSLTKGGDPPPLLPFGTASHSSRLSASSRPNHVDDDENEASAICPSSFDMSMKNFSFGDSLTFQTKDEGRPSFNSNTSPSRANTGVIYGSSSPQHQSPLRCRFAAALESHSPTGTNFKTTQQETEQNTSLLKAQGVEETMPTTGDDHAPSPLRASNKQYSSSFFGSPMPDAKYAVRGPRVLFGGSPRVTSTPRILPRIPSSSATPSPSLPATTIDSAIKLQTLIESDKLMNEWRKKYEAERDIVLSLQDELEAAKCKNRELQEELEAKAHRDEDEAQAAVQDISSKVDATSGAMTSMQEETMALLHRLVQQGQEHRQELSRLKHHMRDHVQDQVVSVSPAVSPAQQPLAVCSHHHHRHICVPGAGSGGQVNLAGSTSSSSTLGGTATSMCCGTTASGSEVGICTMSTQMSSAATSTTTQRNGVRERKKKPGVLYPTEKPTFSATPTSLPPPFDFTTTTGTGTSPCHSYAAGTTPPHREEDVSTGDYVEVDGTPLSATTATPSPTPVKQHATMGTSTNVTTSVSTGVTFASPQQSTSTGGFVIAEDSTPSAIQQRTQLREEADALTKEATQLKHDIKVLQAAQSSGPTLPSSSGSKNAASIATRNKIQQSTEQLRAVEARRIAIAQERKQIDADHKAKQRLGKENTALKSEVQHLQLQLQRREQDMALLKAGYGNTEDFLDQRGEDDENEEEAVDTTVVGLESPRHQGVPATPKRTPQSAAPATPLSPPSSIVAPASSSVGLPPRWVRELCGNNEGSAAKGTAAAAAAAVNLQPIIQILVNPVTAAPGSAEAKAQGKQRDLVLQYIQRDLGLLMDRLKVRLVSMSKCAWQEVEPLVHKAARDSKKLFREAMLSLHNVVHVVSSSGNLGTPQKQRSVAAGGGGAQDHTIISRWPLNRLECQTLPQFQRSHVAQACRMLLVWYDQWNMERQEDLTLPILELVVNEDLLCCMAFASVEMPAPRALVGATISTSFHQYRHQPQLAALGTPPSAQGGVLTSRGTASPSRGLASARVGESLTGRGRRGSAAPVHEDDYAEDVVLERFLRRPTTVNTDSPVTPTPATGHSTQRGTPLTSSRKPQRRGSEVGWKPTFPSEMVASEQPQESSRQPATSRAGSPQAQAPPAAGAKDDDLPAPTNSRSQRRVSISAAPPEVSTVEGQYDTATVLRQEGPATSASPLRTHFELDFGLEDDDE